MRRFLQKIVLYMVLVGVGFVGLYLWYAATLDRRLRLPADVHKVFLGNSTVETAVNDSLLTGAINYALSAEQIEFVYAKLKALKKVNPQIDTVYVGIDNYIWFKPEELDWSNRCLNNAWLLIQFDLVDWLVNMTHRSWKWRGAYFKNVFTFDQWRLNFRREGLLPKGSYLNLTGTMGNPINDEAERRRYDRMMAEEKGRWGNDMLHYMRKIEEYCRFNHIHLRLISTPKHRVTWHDRRFYDVYEKYFSSIPFDDYTRMDLPDSCFYDPMHLNAVGARSFTLQLTSR